MLTGFRDLYTPPDRKTDEAYARMLIGRHEGQYERNQRKKRRYQDIDDGADDRTLVSTQALKLYLENMLDAQGKNQNIIEDVAYSEIEIQKTSPPNTQALQMNTRAALAAQAYRKQLHRAAPSTKKDIRLQSYDVPQFKDADMRIIRSLIRDLDYLQAQHIETIQIEYGAHFLQALRETINHICHPEYYNKQ